MIIDWNVFLSLFTMALSAFMTLIVLMRPGHTRANKYLIGLLWSLIFSQSYAVLYPTGWFYRVPILIKSYIPPQFLIGPFLYFYVSTITDDTFRVKRTGLLHVVPFALVTMYLLPFFLSPLPVKLGFVVEKILSQVPSTMEELLVWACLQISLGTYIVLSLLKVMAYERKIRDVVSNLRKVTLRWLQGFLLAAMLFIPSYLVIDVFLLLGYRLVYFNELIASSLNLVMIFFCVWAMTKIEYILLPAAGELATRQSSRSPDRQETDTQLVARYHHIVDLVLRGEHYLDPAINLPDLAKDLSLTRSDLSKILNQGGGLNFYDFINKLRVMEVKSRLLSEEEDVHSILDLAFSCGFNSKSVFHTAFKKWVGMTPLEVRKKRSMVPENKVVGE